MTFRILVYHFKLSKMEKSVIGFATLSPSTLNPHIPIDDVNHQPTTNVGQTAPTPPSPPPIPPPPPSPSIPARDVGRDVVGCSYPSSSCYDFSGGMGSLASVVGALPAKRAYPSDTDPNIDAKKKFLSGKIAFQWDGFPTMKFGFNKFVCIRLDAQEEMQAIIGDFTCSPPNSGNWYPDEKHVLLNNEQFLKLVGIVYNDFTNTERDPRSIEGNMSTMFHLGGSTFFGEFFFLLLDLKFFGHHYFLCSFLDQY